MTARRLDRTTKVLIVLAGIGGAIFAGLMALVVFGLVRPFSVPTGGMTPAVSAGDHVMMEGVSLLWREPHRGDVIVFRTTGMAQLPSAQSYIERVAGEPGDHVRIDSGRLYINDKRVALSNAAGEITYRLPPQFPAAGTFLDAVVPQGHYYVLGDNSTNSFDSRYYGFVPAANVRGRVYFCQWPPKRWGTVK